MERSPPVQLDRALQHTDRQAIIPVKEPGEEYSYDQRNHRYLTNRQTVFETVEVLKRFEGVEILDLFHRSPYITVKISSEIDPIGELLGLSTIEVINPDFLIWWIDDETAPEQALADHGYPVQLPLAVVIATDNSMYPSLKVEPGDSVYVRYEQPDGSILIGRTYIEEK